MGWTLKILRQKALKDGIIKISKYTIHKIGRKIPTYLRDDIRIDSKEYLSEVLKDYKVCPDDIDKIWEIINKKNSH